MLNIYCYYIIIKFHYAHNFHCIDFFQSLTVSEIIRMNIFQSEIIEHQVILRFSGENFAHWLDNILLNLPSIYRKLLVGKKRNTNLDYFIIVYPKINSRNTRGLFYKYLDIVGSIHLEQRGNPTEQNELLLDLLLIHFENTGLDGGKIKIDVKSQPEEEGYFYAKYARKHPEIILDPRLKKAVEPLLEYILSKIKNDFDLLEFIGIDRIGREIKLSKNRKNEIHNEKYWKPNIRTQERYKVFKNLKDKHPGWTLEKVALEASPKLEEDVSGETVRNTYRSMGKEWVRGDRTR